jgi:hypothetical protein
MKKFLFVLFIFCCLSSKVFSNQVVYNSNPLIDSKTNLEIGRVMLPDSFNIDFDTVWKRDFETPLQYFVTAKSSSDDSIFFFSSQKSYVDILNSLNNNNEEIDSDFRITKKSFSLPKDFIFETFSASNPNASDIKLVNEKFVSEELSDYLKNQLYLKIQDLYVTAKSDNRYSKIQISNPQVYPYIVTYTFSDSGKSYNQMYITMFLSIDYEYIPKKFKKHSGSVHKKFWINKGVFSYRVETKNFDKYYDDFIVFVSNMMMNNKASFALEQVKSEMWLELKPDFIDVHNKTHYRNIPSELFQRYMTLGVADYSEETPMQKPTLDNIRWLTDSLVKQNEFSYRTRIQVLRQKIYAPEKYEYVYKSKSGNSFLFSTELLSKNKKYIQIKKDDIYSQK